MDSKSAQRQIINKKTGQGISKSPCDPQTTVYSGVFDYNKLQGTYSGPDLIDRIPRDINHRYITIENSSDRTFACAINADPNTCPTKSNFLIGPNGIKELGINDLGTSSSQWLWIINPRGKPMGPPTILDNATNQFVIRNGENVIFVQRFHRAGYKATS